MESELRKGEQQLKEAAEERNLMLAPLLLERQTLKENLAIVELKVKGIEEKHEITTRMLGSHVNYLRMKYDLIFTLGEMIARGIPEAADRFCDFKYNDTLMEAKKVENHGGPGDPNKPYNKLTYHPDDRMFDTYAAHLVTRDALMSEEEKKAKLYEMFKKFAC